MVGIEREPFRYSLMLATTLLSLPFWSSADVDSTAAQPCQRFSERSKMARVQHHRVWTAPRAQLSCSYFLWGLCAWRVTSQDPAWPEVAEHLCFGIKKEEPPHLPVAVPSLGISS